jgi:ABC-type xylose transport system substrate-binding protein
MTAIAANTSPFAGASKTKSATVVCVQMKSVSTQRWQKHQPTVGFQA